ncbi:TetR/AcrR family transcriptional regulator [Acidiferrobacter sp.]|uniref:TetR/AcrR family transcriptional regulator n=1 Tax=Acidiferrobacter sp. TaxID=1872107 RepID=UPI002603756B|nr:TetR/AcrR family transcriptional regulator [Acidiferrobacter sp.]
MEAVLTRDTTRARLLQAAFGEIYRHGFQAAGLSAILRDTGLTKGALYHYFPSKRALGLAVIDEVIQGRLAEMIFRPLEGAGDPYGVLLALLGQRLQTVDDETATWGCPLNNLTQEMSPIDADFREHLSAILARWQGVVQAALERAQAQGRVRAGLDCEAASLFLVAAWEGCWGVAKTRQSVSVFRQCLGELCDYVQGLAASP